MFRNKQKYLVTKIAGIFIFTASMVLLMASPKTVSAAGTLKVSDVKGSHQCGTQSEAVRTSINFGCRGEICLHGSSDPICNDSNHQVNAILDALFAIIRFLSIGVGLVIITSTIIAGIQYSTSRGDPQATAKAVSRITNTLIALLVFIFAYAIINWLVPGRLLK